MLSPRYWRGQGTPSFFKGTYELGVAIMWGTVIVAVVLAALAANSLGWHRWRRPEYGFAPNWSVGVEYDHLFMQDITHQPVVNFSKPIVSVRTSISSPRASTSVLAARSSPVTDFPFNLRQT
jgi:hypothetical protein